MTSFLPHAPGIPSNLVDVTPLNTESVSPVRVLVVQDHPLLASAIARVLDNEEDLTVVGIARRGDEAATLAAEHKPAVVLMDFRLPDLTGPAAAAKIRTAVPTALAP